MDEEAAIVRRRRGWWLRVARERAGMTQSAVAHELGLRTGTAVVHWENGDRDPSVLQLTALADLYGMTLDFFSRPPVTDEEWLDDYARGATSLGREDARREAEARRAAGARPSEPLDRRPR